MNANCKIKIQSNYILTMEHINSLVFIHHATNWKFFIIWKPNHSWNYFRFYQVGWVVLMCAGCKWEKVLKIIIFQLGTLVRAYPCKCFQDYYCLKCKVTSDDITKCRTIFMYCTSNRYKIRVLNMELLL